MVDSIPALSTSVIATVRRDSVAVTGRQPGASTDTTQAKTAYVPQPAPITPEAAGNLSDLNEQIAQIMAKANAAAGIEPADGQANTLQGRANAAYRLVNSFDSAGFAPTLSLTA